MSEVKKLPPFERSFASNKIRSVCWNVSLNGDVTPKDIYKSTKDKYWFNCDKCPHIFLKSLNDVNEGRWCEYCSNKKLCDNKNCKECEKKSFVLHDKSKYWNYSLNNGINPRQVFNKNSTIKYWFNCEKCHHNFDLKLSNINQGNWCPYCSHNKLCDDMWCEFWYNNSFFCHSKSKFWSTNNEDTPRDLFLGGGQIREFKCGECSHYFKTQLQHITKNNGEGSWCHYCTNQKLCEDEKCKLYKDKSFESCDKHIYMNKEKNNKTARQIFKSSNVRIYFDCPKCKHSFDAIASNINNRHSWCPFCADQKLCGKENCEICIVKSFATQTDAIKYWDFSGKNKDKDGNILYPYQVFKNSSTIHIIFNCIECGKDYKATPATVSRGSWCNCKKNKTETKLLKKLTEFFPTIIKNFKVDWCKNERHLPFDLAIIDYKIIIELDGQQHLKQVANWKTPEHYQTRDKYKMKCANENSYSVIRLLQYDVWNDKYDWLDEIIKNINLIVNEKKIQNIMMCKNKEYDVYGDLTYFDEKLIYDID